MKPALTEDCWGGVDITPLGAALVELHYLHGAPFEDAFEFLTDMYEQDRSCPVSAHYRASEVRAYYRERGEEVNAVPITALAARIR